MDTIPCILFHIGNHPYVHLCLKQALYFNNDVHILTDIPSQFNYDGLTTVSFQNYSLRMNQFQPMYKHFSTNSYQLEFICIVRWMCIYEYMQQKGIKKAFIFDSDILLYSNISEIIKTHLHEDMYLCTSVSKNVTGSASVFTLDKLEKFVQFTFQFYKTQIPNIINWKKNYTENGGICDMTLLYYFAHEKTEFVGLRLPNLPYFKNDLTTIFNDDFTFDLNVGVTGNQLYPNDYEMKDSRKIITMDNKQSFCYNNRLNKRIRFVTLHFQGPHKRVMDKYFVNI